MPDVFTKLYINIPIAVLDYKQLIADNQPENTNINRLTEGELLTMFKYEQLALLLQSMLEEERIFYQNVSGAMMKLL